MRVQVDGQDVITLEEWQKKVIMNDIPEEEFDLDMKRRVAYVLEHKFERCYERLHKQWMKIFEQDPNVESIPTNQQQFAQMVFADPRYQSRSQRDSDERG